MSLRFIAATWHAQERARLVNIGKTPPFVDGQIAACCKADPYGIAKVNGLILITNNLSDYVNF